MQTGSRGRPAVSCSCWQTNYKTTQNVGAAHIWQNIRRHTDTSFFLSPPLLFPLLFSFLRTQPIRHHPPAPHLSPARYTPCLPPLPPTHTNTMVRNTVAMYHAESGHIKKLWNGKSTMHLKHSRGSWRNTAVEVSDAGRRISEMNYVERRAGRGLPGVTGRWRPLTAPVGTQLALCRYKVQDTELTNMVIYSTFTSCGYVAVTYCMFSANIYYSQSIHIT